MHLEVCMYGQFELATCYKMKQVCKNCQQNVSKKSRELKKSLE